MAKIEDNGEMARLQATCRDLRRENSELRLENTRNEKIATAYAMGMSCIKIALEKGR